MASEQERSATERNGVAWVVGVGASRGIGAAVARRFAREGFTVVLTGRSVDSLSAIVNEVTTLGGKAVAARGDAQNEGDLLAILRMIEKLGPLEVGVYNAGNAAWAPTLETTSETFEAVWRTGCLGGFAFGREVVRAMLPRGRGTLLFTGASASLRGRAAFVAFAAAKAGLRMVGQSLAREFGPQGIHVAHVIVDGSVYGDKILNRVPDILERKGPDGLLDPDAIADAYWFLHAQHRSAWSHELDLRTFKESF
jgi:NAD(P)-dependent dehydrogenase (short-subunit alcohol dehydrogenase family)